MMYQTTGFTHLRQVSLSMGAMLTTIVIGSMSPTENAIALSDKLTSTTVMGTIPTSVEVYPPSLIDRLYDQIVGEETVSSDETSSSSSPSDTESTTASDSNSSAPRFTCQYTDGQYTVMYAPEDDSRKYYAWATPRQMGGGWTPERRCNAIAQRLEAYRPDGLRELQTGKENELNVVCVTTTENEDCRIVFTVPEEQDPMETRDRVFENLAVANSGQETAGINTFQSSSSVSSIWGELGGLDIDLPQLPRQNASFSSERRSQGIDLRPFLAPSDGGTGSNL